MVGYLRYKNRGFPKTSVFGKATLDLGGKSGLRPLFLEHFLKPTGFWEMLKKQPQRRIRRNTSTVSVLFKTRQKGKRPFPPLPRRLPHPVPAA
jgi:hypothetical protein